jgi:hypothetical protein
MASSGERVLHLVLVPPSFSFLQCFTLRGTPTLTLCCTWVEHGALASALNVHS